MPILESAAPWSPGATAGVVGLLYSVLRTRHSAIPNRSIHGRPSGYSDREAARWRPCPGNECGVRNAECAMRNTVLHRVAWSRLLVVLDHPPAHIIIGPVEIT